MPSWPSLFRPPHQSEPSFLSAQVTLSLPELAPPPPHQASATSPPNISRRLGTRASLPEMIPSWSPQHQSVSSSRTAHDSFAFAASLRTPESIVTAVGLKRPIVVPSPSCPLQFTPQQDAVPSGARAHVWFQPATICVVPLPSETTWIGPARMRVVLSPSCPKKLSPQHHTVPSFFQGAVVSCADDHLRGR